MLDRVLINFELIKTQSYDRSMIPVLPQKADKKRDFKACEVFKTAVHYA